MGNSSPETAATGGFRLVVEGPERREFVLESGTVTVGRSETNQVVVDDDRASRTHARLDATGEGIEVCDLGSTNGTLVNGQRVERRLLSAGDEVQIGSTILRVEAGGQRATAGVTTLATQRDVQTALLHAPLPTIVTDLARPSLVVHDPDGTRVVELSGESALIGRDPQAAVVLSSPDASHRHARIERRGRDFYLRDLGSRNGTFVRGERIDERRLTDGDTIRIGSARVAFKAGFTAAELDATGLLRTVERRPVVIVPGVMGSDLWRGSERVWPNLRTLFEPGVTTLPEQTPLEARAILQEIVVVPNLVKLDQYSRLGNFLVETLGYERGRDLLEFPYDWRLDCRISARRLGKAIEEWQERTKEARGPVTVIAHSLGCLVSRYYVERLGGSRDVERLILLGGPHRGTPQAIPTLVKGPKILPFGALGDRMRAVITTYPSSYQYLPTYRCATDEQGRKIDVYSEDGWVSDAHRAMLADGRAFRRELASAATVPTVCVFGYGLDTLARVKVKVGEGRGWERLELSFERGGDTAVPEMSAVLDGAGIHPVRQHHGSLYTDNDVKMRLTMELTRNIHPGV